MTCPILSNIDTQTFFDGFDHCQSGVFIDVGAERDGFLHVNEWGDGLPAEQPFARNVPAPWRGAMRFR